MAELNYNWETWFDTASKLMYHKFSDRVVICTSFQTGTTKVFKDGSVINEVKSSEMTIPEYTQFIITTAKDAAVLPPYASN